METGLVITLHNMTGTPAAGEAERFVRECFRELRETIPMAFLCRVFLEKTNRRRKHGSPFLVRITVQFPASPEIVVTREPCGIIMRDALRTTIHNAFIAVKRKVAEQAGENPAPGRIHAAYGAVVSAIFPDKGYGFLRTDSGKEIFFQRSSVAGGGFDIMKEGTGVWFIEHESVNGPWASAVRICPPTP